jgi:parvulin-like peptidyl-prolyl isomerase
MAGRRSLLVLLFSLLAVALALAVGLGGPSARASHILVSTEEQADELAALLDEAEDLPSAFAELAAEYSQCPSGRRGGDLGTFGRGQMVPEFDAVVFERSVGAVHKVYTQVRGLLAR